MRFDIIGKTIIKHDPNKNETMPFLSIYEKTSMIGLRLSQLSLGAKSVLTSEQLELCDGIKEIVYKELETRKIPFMVKRTLPNDVVEYWNIEDLIIT
jgi:DNA-directed RNA polymerases I, II, and III subunit RPABC2|uniref:RNA polymerase Rpb6 n=1 Tax=viral metagenome TaxID=1070528 RepID=A0A6C0BP24_9ZZZZ